MAETWQDRMAQRLDDMKMTKKDLAAKIGLTSSAVCHWFKNDKVNRVLQPRRTPRLREFEKVATVLKCDMQWLIFGDTDKNIKIDYNYLGDCFKSVNLANRYEQAKMDDKQKIILATLLYTKYHDRPVRELTHLARQIIRGT